MATVIKSPPFQTTSLPVTRGGPIFLKSQKPISLSFGKRPTTSLSGLYRRDDSLRFASVQSLRFVKLPPLASAGEAESTGTQEEIQEPQDEDSLDGAIGVGDSASDNDTADLAEDDTTDAKEAPSSFMMETLKSYKEALASNDDARTAEIEAFLKSIEDEKSNLESELVKLSEELSTERDRVLRISADFDNFRKRTERERLSLVTNAQGEVVERLLQVLDNFERAKTQIKVQTEGEEKINNSYQSIYKQLVEILGSLGVIPVETVGNPFDPMLHEAIMREDSSEFEEGVIMEEFRKGFKLGDRLLRPSMVKVSAGPGPANPKVQPSEGEVVVGETTESSSTEEVEAEAS